MKLKYIIRALGTQFILGHGLHIDLPFGMVSAEVYAKQGWARLQAEFLATGFEFMRVVFDTTGDKKVTLFSLELRLLGNTIRFDSRGDLVSFMNIVTYVRMMAAEFEEIDDTIDL